MTTSDWVALGGLIVSCFAFAVSVIGYRLQQRTAKSDNEKELADQIAAIQDQMATPNLTAQPTFLAGAGQQAAAQEAMAKASSTNAALQMLVLRVGNLIGSTGVTPDWYQNLVLAAAAVRIGDYVMARPYVQAAVDLASHPEDRGWSAETAAAAEMLSLQVLASYLYNLGRPEDVKAARTAFGQAGTLVESVREQQGPYMTAGRLAELNIRQAEFELDLGYDDRAVALIGEACRQWQKAHVPAVRQVIGNLIWAFATAQGRMPIGTLLTSEFVAAWDEFQRGVRGPSAAPGAAGPGSPAPGSAGLGPDDLVEFNIVRPDGQVAPVAPPPEASG